MSDNNLTSEELTDDIEVIGPGQMLADARQKLGFSQEYVAEKLNFKHSLVIDIEQERFDKALPATYNRGYLKNYAKLVNISAEEILSSYEMLGVAETQSAEMQSFSKNTEKQTQNNILTWVTYLILAVLIGTTVMWLQDNNNISFDSDVEAIVDEPQAATLPKTNITETAPLPVTSTDDAVDEVDSQEIPTESAVDNVSETNLSPSQVTDDVETLTSSDEQSLSVQNLPSAEVLADVVFNFSGDCWVNIYDAKGERIAWGVKKSGYEMKISALAPLVVTLGKPELVQISYNNEAIDMSQFNTGNIAKFNLPIAANL